MDNVYFANLDKEQIGNEIIERAKDYVKYADGIGLRAAWEEIWIKYHNHRDGFNKGIVERGSQGELAKLTVNQLRNIIQQILNMATQSRPALIPRAINSDPRSLDQARIANGLIDYYLREKSVERLLLLAAEYSLTYGSGYVKITWDKFGGEFQRANVGYNQETGQLEKKGPDFYEGDLNVGCPDIKDIFYDPRKKSWYDNQWITVRVFRNKHDLAAIYPEHANEILNINDKDNNATNESKSYNSNNLGDINGSGSKYNEEVETFEFFHKKTLSIPKGRQAVLLSSGTVLEDSVLQYDEIPVYKISPLEFLGSQVGYAPAFDLQGLQEVFDMIYSMIATNIKNFGLQSVQTPQGTIISHNELINSTIYETPTGETGGVKPVRLLDLPQELISMVTMTEKQIETISGVNSVARGSPEASQRSGTALALIHSMALIFNSGFQNAYARLLENVGTAIIRLVKRNSQSQKVISIAGIRNRSVIKTFTADKIKDIDRVVADIGNPLMRTVSGRMEIATMLIQNQIIKNVDEFLTVIQTGQLEPLVQAETAELSLIHQENEALMEGQFVEADEFDRHELHMPEHQALLSDISVRRNPALKQLIKNHIKDHENKARLMSMTQPDLLLMLGRQPLVPMPPMGSPEAQQMMNAQPPVDAMGQPVEPSAGNVPNPAQPPPIPGQEE